MEELPDETMIGVVIVAYGSEDVLPACLDSLAAASHEDIKIVVIDNASPDDSAAVVRRHAAAQGMRNGAGFLELPAENADSIAGKLLPPLTLIRAADNRGFGAGCNIGLKLLRQDPEVDLFWLLNPDTEVPLQTPSAYALRAASGEAGLMGGRVLFHAPPNLIQSDGGRLNRWTGFCRNINYGCRVGEAALPAPEEIDFLLGANMVATRTFLDQAGMMPEDYFLYYEEVEWAQRRGDLPLTFVPEAIVLHHGGTAAGTGGSRGKTTPLSHYYNYRNRMRFLARHNPIALPNAYAVSVWKAFAMLRAGAWAAGMAALRGMNQFPRPETTPIAKKK
jgi:GT2 family glycosyltransferase